MIHDGGDNFFVRLRNFVVALTVCSSCDILISCAIIFRARENSNPNHHHRLLRSSKIDCFGLRKSRSKNEKAVRNPVLVQREFSPRFFVSESGLSDLTTMQRPHASNERIFPVVFVRIVLQSNYLVDNQL